MQALGQARQFVRRKPPAPHRQLRGRAMNAVVLVGIVDLIGTVLMWFFEDEAARSEIHNLWDALFFSTVQLLTVSSQMPNPVTTGGRIVDIALQLTAICFVTGIAGAFAKFFMDLDSDRQE
jgi:Ion channel